MPPRLTPAQIATRLSPTAREILTGQHRAVYSPVVRGQSYRALARRRLVHQVDGAWTRTELGEQVARACLSPAVEVSARMKEAIASMRRAYTALADVVLDERARNALDAEVIGLREETNVVKARLTR